jgi:hypothetical protein
VHFDETSWSVVSTPTLSGRAQFEGVAAAASKNAWAVGAQDISNTRMAEPLVEYWNVSVRNSQGGAPREGYRLNSELRACVRAMTYGEILL